MNDRRNEIRRVIREFVLLSPEHHFPHRDIHLDTYVDQKRLYTVDLVKENFHRKLFL